MGSIPSDNLSDPEESGRRKSNSSKAICLLGTLSLVLYGWITWLSKHFYYSGDPQALAARPILTVLVLFALAFVCYLAAVFRVQREQHRRPAVWLIVLFSILFRLLTLISTPIQEVDIYRYLWDGEVCTHHISPFQYPPNAVIAAIERESGDPDLDYLAKHCRNHESLQELLSRIHFRDLPTVYPPVSQIVFAGAALVTPDRLSVDARVLIMKVWLVGFDLLTLGLVIRLLIGTGLPGSYCIIYGWCPLLMKEISNSGHLDSIATFLATLAVYFLVSSVARKSMNQRQTWFSYGVLLSSGCLAMSVGAKIFPVVLVPVFSAVVARHFGWLMVLKSAIIFSLLVVAMAYPMVVRQEAAVEKQVGGRSETVAIEPSEGLTTFFKYWEMNDLVFMVVVENLKDESRFPANGGIWFSVAPEGIRQSLASTTDQLGIPPNEGPFLTTRFITSLVFVGFALWIAVSAFQANRVEGILQSVFLTIAAFWFLSPTQNPWYWTWALPFLPFVTQRAWYWVGGLTLAYYLRFWFDYHFNQQVVVSWLGRDYVGTEFFDYFMPWIEFGPILVWILVARLSKFWNSNQNV